MTIISKKNAQNYFLYSNEHDILYNNLSLI